MCEIAWSFRGAARYQSLVATLSDNMVFLGTIATQKTLVIKINIFVARQRPILTDAATPKND